MFVSTDPITGHYRLKPTATIKPPALALLASLNCLSPFAMSVVVPALPALGTAFMAEAGQIQWIVSGFLLGLGIAQPVLGPLIDRFGRRRILLIFLALFIAASALAAYATTLPTLVLFRFLQAVGASAATVASRTILRDLFSGNRMARAMAIVAAVTGLAPVLAPPIGGYLVDTVGWPSAFAVVAGSGVLLLGLVILRLPETLPKEQRRPLALGSTLADSGTLFTSLPFVGNTLIFGFANGAYMTFATAGPLFFKEQFGVGATQFGAYWSILAILFMAGALVTTRLSLRVGAPRLLALGLSVNAFATLGLLLAVWLVGPRPWTLVLPMALMTGSHGITHPLALSGAVNPFPEKAGIASGLVSASGMALAALFAMVTGWTYNGSVAVILCGVVLGLLGALVGLALLRLARKVT